MVTIPIWHRARHIVALLAILGLVLSSFPSKTFQRTKAGTISSPTWSLSSTTENATNVTYTHTFTTATAVPAGGTVDIEIRLPMGPMQPLPSFTAARVSSDSTAGVADVTPNIFYAGSMVSLSITTTAQIPAGLITVKLNGVTNPSVGGIFQTNTSTSYNFSALDGKRYSSDTNGKLIIGTVKLSGVITDSTTGQGIAGVSLEIHPGPTSVSFGFWKTTTDSSGAYSFAGLANGAFVFEMSPNVDPNSTNATTVSQYSRFEPINLTITDSPQTLNKSLAKSQKLITGKILYDGTSNPVVGAMVNAGSMGGGFANTQTASDGSFTLRIAATGQVFVMIQPTMSFQGQGNQQSVTATDFGSVQRQVSFVKPTSEAETFALGTIAVKKADATVSGILKNPDGSAATGGAGLMNFRDHSFTPLQLQNDGSFNTKVVSGGTWKIDSFDPTGLYSMPNVSFTPKKGTNSLGTITKITNNKTITITAKRIDGGTERALANAQAMIFSKEPGPPYMATTNSSGIAEVKVPEGFEGRAGVMPGGTFGGGPKGGEGPGGPGGHAFFPYLLGLEKAYAENGQGQESDTNQLFPVTGFQKVKASDSITAKFDKADKTIQIRTVDSNGQLVTQGGFVDIALPSGFHMGCPTAGGLGTCNAVAGTVTARVMFPPDSTYAGKSKSITVADSTTSANLDVVQKTATITGEVQDGSNNNAVIKDATLGINVGAFSADGFFLGRYNPSTGTYTVSVPPDTKVRLGVMAGDPGRGVDRGGYVPNISSDEVSAGDGKSTTKHVKLTKVDALIKATVKDDSGNVVEGATVVASNTLADIVGPEGPGGPEGPHGPGPEEGPDFGFTGVTNENGLAEIPVAPDKYNLVVKASGLFPISVTQTEPQSGETKEVSITLAKADSTLKAEINKGDGTDLTGATLQIFDDAGRVNLTIEDGDSDSGDQDGQINGVVEVKVPKGTYTTQAGEDFPDTGKVEESDYKKIIAQSNQTSSFELKTSTENNALEKPVTVEVSSTSASAVALPDGNTISLPQGALSSSGSSSESDSSGGNPVLEVAEIKADLPETKTDTPVGTGISINAIDSSGNSITSLNGIVTGQIHYEDGDLPAGASESNLKVKAFNESTGLWESVQGSSVDTDTNTVNFSTNHFTDFAVVTTTDTNAPSAPTNITATDAKTGGKVDLAWTNPTDSDFAQIRIYRSTTDGSVGTAITTISSKTTTSYSDSNLTNKTKYYYVVRALDSNGNESANTTQVSATPTKSKLPKTGLPSWLGMIDGLVDRLVGVVQVVIH